MSKKRIAYLRDAIAGAEFQIYDAHVKLTADDRFDISMRLSNMRQELAQLLKIANPTACTMIETPEEE
jgi:2C-methyl-D-erythritol 2,4-cyclodiphosphate synthase